MVSPLVGDSGELLLMVKSNKTMPTTEDDFGTPSDCLDDKRGGGFAFSTATGTRTVLSKSKHSVLLFVYNKGTTAAMNTKQQQTKMNVCTVQSQ